MPIIEASQQNWQEKSPLPRIDIVACALVDADHRVLIAKRPQGKELAGYWEFPGGKITPPETPEEALLRECKEELGLLLEHSCIAPLAFSSYRYATFHLLLLLYICRKWDGVISSCRGARVGLGLAARFAQA